MDGMDWIGLDALLSLPLTRSMYIIVQKYFFSRFFLMFVFWFDRFGIGMSFKNENDLGESLLTEMNRTWQNKELNSNFKARNFFWLERGKYYFFQLAMNFDYGGWLASAFWVDIEAGYGYGLVWPG